MMEFSIELYKATKIPKMDLRIAKLRKEDWKKRNS